MEVSKNKNQKNKIAGIASLKEGLSALKVADLQDIRKKLQIKNINSLKKAEFLLMNNTRKWYLKGYTSKELSTQEKKALRPLPQQKGEVISLQTRQQVGRNDPCPCGSGKKFKKCCGN